MAKVELRDGIIEGAASEATLKEILAKIGADGKGAKEATALA